MKQARWRLALLIVLLVGASSVSANSTPVVAGSVQMIELCPQSICGIALFAGIFQGRIGANPHAIGTVVVAVNHDPLPSPGDPCAGVLGAWQIRTLTRTIGGGAAGTLCATSPLTFDVNVGMLVTKGGSGTLGFSGVLDHTPFPPTLNGDIFQAP